MVNFFVYFLIAVLLLENLEFVEGKEQSSSTHWKKWEMP